MAADSIGACWKWPHWAEKHFSCSRKVTSRQKALTRDFAPYCFSTFSRSCLKQASKRSWKGLSASVTFSPWMRTPSARCGIWRGQNIKCEKPSSNITWGGVGGWCERLVACRFFIHWRNMPHTSNLTLITFGPLAVHTQHKQWLYISLSVSVCTKRKYHCSLIQVEVEKSVAMTPPSPCLPPPTSTHQTTGILNKATRKHRQTTCIV